MYVKRAPVSSPLIVVTRLSLFVIGTLTLPYYKRFLCTRCTEVFPTDLRLAIDCTSHPSNISRSTLYTYGHYGPVC